MQFEPVDDWSHEQWNEAIAPFDSSLVYHRSEWLAFLQATGRGRLLRFRMVDGGRTVGYFPALLVRKGPFRILGSPVSASMSEHMGPVANSDMPVEPFLVALDTLCRSLRVAQAELGSPLLRPEDMRAHGYEVNEWNTLQVALSPDVNAMFAALNGKARNRIRKAQKLGLLVEDVSAAAFPAEHFEAVCEVFARQGLAPPFPRSDYDALFKHLKPADLVFTIQVRHPDTREVLASGLFPHDARRAYSLSTATSMRGRECYASDLLHWSLISLAGTRGLQYYRMGDNYRPPTSGGRFKDKFSGEAEPVHRYVRHYSALARHARNAYVAWQRLRQRLAGRRRQATS